MTDDMDRDLQALIDHGIPVLVEPSITVREDGLVDLEATIDHEPAFERVGLGVDEFVAALDELHDLAIERAREKAEP